MSGGIIPLGCLVVVVAAGAAAHLVVPRSPHVVESPPVVVRGLAPEGFILLVHNAGYADLLKGAPRRPAAERAPAPHAGGGRAP